VAWEADPAAWEEVDQVHQMAWSQTFRLRKRGWRCSSKADTMPPLWTGSQRSTPSCAEVATEGYQVAWGSRRAAHRAIWEELP